MTKTVEVNGLRMGIPNPETDEQFEERLPKLIFDFLCNRLRTENNNNYVSFEDVENNFGAADPSRRIAAYFNLMDKTGLIESNEESGFRLTGDGIKKCMKNVKQ